MSETNTPEVVVKDDTENGGTPQTPEKTEEEEGRIDSVVEEMKDLRKDNRELRELIKNSVKTPEVTPQEEDSDVKKAVKEVLSEERRGNAEVNRKEALERFLVENTEFHADNDSTGLKLGALEREMGSLRTDKLYSVEDFVKAFGKAKKLLETEKSTETTVTPNADSPVNTGSPASTPTSKLNPQELALIKQAGWTEERYLKLKENQPAFVEKLLKNTQ